ncbi:hypothetical protein [Burkholderia sp. 22PA0106]|uniref:hypothetical protein n=1 Tax=Burkholderia sp. 22PA0106 TaxID=3237371 RepID=UPI0039C25DA4
MSEVNPWQRAAIYRNSDFILIETQSGHRVSIADPDGSMHFLDTAELPTTKRSAVVLTTRCWQAVSSPHSIVKKIHSFLTSDWSEKTIKMGG